MRAHPLYPLLLLVVLTGMVRAQPSTPPMIKLPEEVRGNVGDFVTVRAETNGKVVRWISLDVGLKVFPVELLKDSLTAVVTAGQPGRYRLWAYTALGDEPSSPAACLVTIGSPGPPPPPPPPPGPADPLLPLLVSAYKSETDPMKNGQLSQLAALYRQAADLANTRLDLTTWGALFDTMSTAATTLGLRGKIPGIQTAIATELKAKLPTNRATELDAAGRKTASTMFLRLADLLERVPVQAAQP